jgi:hypothetical protein
MIEPWMWIPLVVVLLIMCAEGLWETIKRLF